MDTLATANHRVAMGRGTVLPVRGEFVWCNGFHFGDARVRLSITVFGQVQRADVVCPARTEETAAQYAAARTFLTHDLSTIDDLNRYLANYFGGGFVILNHTLWVNRRPNSPYIAGSLPDPSVPPTVANTDPAIYGWPVKTTDRASAHVPFLSDACFSGYAAGNPGGTSVENINITGANNAATLMAAKKTSGHTYGRSRGAISVNLVFADGHVSSHNKKQLRCVYVGDSNSGWFY